MNKLIILLIPWVLLCGCSEPDNGGGRVVETKIRADGTESPQPLRLVTSAVLPPANKVTVPPEPIAANPRIGRKAEPTGHKRYGGYTFDQIVEAIIYVESKGNRKAKGRDTERGLMQVRYKTWKWTCRYLLKKKAPWKWAYHPYWNKLVGKAYLKYCINSFKGSPTQMWDGIRAYNKGVRGSRKGRGFGYLRKVQRRLKSQ